MSYKNKSDANRDALFGSAGGGGGSSKGPRHKVNAAANRDALFGGAGGGSSKPTSRSNSRSSSATPPPSAAPAPPPVTGTTSRGYQSKARKPAGVRSLLSPEAMAAKIKEAEDYKQKANKAMEKGFFARPDPVAASTYYKRAAECYQQVGDERMERLYRVSSGQCNMQINAWASAATDYTRAAELALEAPDLPDLATRRNESAMHHRKAAEAWTNMNERAKAATSQVAAAMALNYGAEGTMLSKEALTGLEEAVEAFVPDVFNNYARYRQTGHSAFVDPDSDETIVNPSAETMQVANEHLVTRSYSHEPLQDLIYLLVGFGEYASALYAAGAATFLLEKEDLSTLTLGRAYVTETILTLAMGDPIAAEQEFLKRHVQKTSYLSSRECKLAEDLFRAVKMRDADALEEARSPSGSNRAGLANLHESLRTLVQQIRISGVARKTVGETKSNPKPKKKPERKSSSGSSSSSGKKKKPAPPAAAAPAPEPEAASLQDLMGMKTGYEQEAQEGAHLDGAALANELDALDFGDDSVGGNDDLEDDDDFDLR